MNQDPKPAPISSSQSPVQTQNHNLDQNQAPSTKEDSTTGSSGGPDPVQSCSSPMAPSKHHVQTPAEVQTNSTMNSVNSSVPCPGPEVPNAHKDPDPNHDHSLNLGNNPTSSPGSVPSAPSYPVQIKSLDSNQTIVLTKPSGPDQSPSQSIVVKVPALALLKALVQNTGQTHVRIPLQTQGAGSVLVPSTTPSNIHLTASVQSLMHHQGVVQNIVQSPGLILSPVRNTGPIPNPVISPGLEQKPIQISIPTSATVQIPVPNPVQAPLTNSVQSKTPLQNPIKNSFLTPTPVWTKTAVSYPVWTSVTTQSLAPDTEIPAESSSSPGPDSGLDTALVRVPLPPGAVRALSPPLETMPLKASVPPLGFRLNGKLITLLPGAAEGLEVSVRNHPTGSKSSLTSLHLTKTPAPVVFPDVPRPSIRLPRPLSTESRPFLSVSKEPPQNIIKKTLPPLKVKKQKTLRPPKPKPRPYLTIPKPHSEKPKAAAAPSATSATAAPAAPTSTSATTAAAAATFLRKGEVVRRRRSDCTVCKSHFKPVPELRGFACMCSSDVTSALQILKLRRKDDRVKSRLKKTLNLLNQQQRVSKPHSFHSYATSKSLSALQKPLRASENFLSKPRPSVSPGVQRPQPSVSPGVPRARPSPSPGVSRPHPSPSPDALGRSEVSSPRSGAEVTVGGSVGKLVILLEDFYYGTAEGEAILEQFRVVSKYRCIHCTQVLANNISLMQHTRDHIMKRFILSCPHCFRQFFSSHKLQRHVVAVHGPGSHSSRVVCQICECEFENEIALLLHMKDVHKPGEMPYACALCGFRSSFFAQTWRHFEKVHADTKHFLCHYCLRTFKMEHTYQQHMAIHMRKQVYNCDRCRLQFHLAKDRQDHQEQHHSTHVRPAQLNGLRPGTTVAVRTFQVTTPESPGQTKASPALCKVVPRVLHRQKKACKRRAVENLGQLLAQVQSSESSRCVECLSPIQDFQTHFPSRVTCSQCRFQTCCSRAFANHMINNHSGKTKRMLYSEVFSACPRLDCSPECLICGFSCQTGDTMALHLSRYTKHICLLMDTQEEELSDQEDEQSPVGSRGGFISIEHLCSSHLSITTLDRPAHLSSPAAMTITVRDPCHSAPKPPAPLSISQLSAVLHLLLHGTASASKHFPVLPALIGRWAREQKKNLANRRWRWSTTGGAHWVLTEREQNRIVPQEAILDLSRRTLGPKTTLLTRLNWAVDFLLRHDLGVETRSKELRDIGYSLVTSTWDRVSSLHTVPSRFCCLDEFPVFMDPRVLSSLAPDALRVWGHRKELPLVEVLLCGTSDGSLLPPMLFYNKDLPALPIGFPTNIILQAREGGYSPGDKAQLWADKVLRPHLGDSAPSLLLLDKHCGHMMPEFKAPLQHLSTELVYIPHGCGFLVQPLEQCVTPVVREFLQVRWTQLVSQSPDFSESDLVLTLACWFSEVCHILNSNKDFIHRSFLCVGMRYKTAEVTHHTLNQSLHQALIQTAPPVSTTSQSEECEEEGLKAGGRERMEQDQSEHWREAEEVGLQNKNQLDLQEQVIEPEVMEVDQSDPQEELEETGLQLEGQSEA